MPVPIFPDLEIPDGEIRFVASRSGGPGGQNVNKVSSRITLLFDVAASEALGDDQRRMIVSKLRSRINRDGVLQVSSQKHRDQSMNRAAAVARFAELLRSALTEPPPRRKSRTPAAAKRKRLEEKKKRAELKAQRGGKWS